MITESIPRDPADASQDRRQGAFFAQAIKPGIDGIPILGRDTAFGEIEVCIPFKMNILMSTEFSGGLPPS